MRTLEIDLNCMCLLVPDPAEGSKHGRLHVLMPNTSHHHGAPPHAVQLSYLDAGGSLRATRLEGWALELGSPPGDACCVIAAANPADGEGEVIDLTAVLADLGNGAAPLRVPRTMLEGLDSMVHTRITFNSGEVVRFASQVPEWELNGHRAFLAHQVTWRMKLAGDSLDWRGKGPFPLASLAEVRDEDGVVRLHLHHVTEAALQGGAMPSTTALKLEEVREHFGMYYMLFGIHHPDEKTMLPMAVQEAGGGEDKPGGATGWACKVAQAQPTPWDNI